MSANRTGSAQQKNVASGAPSRQNCAASAVPASPLPARPLKGFQPGARALGSFVPKLTQKAFEKYGFSAATLLTDWAVIVGPDLAAFAVPEKLKWPRGVEVYADPDLSEVRGRPGATLILRVEGARALEVQYRAGQIIERINAYFGYRAITEMRIMQAPLAAASPANNVSAYKKLEPPANLPRPLAAIDDEPLRTALARMSAGLAGRRKEAV